jgi:glycerol-3-phosphate acyltransferase PlsY
LSFYFILIILISYLYGSIPFSLIIPKTFWNIDPRNYGSGNIGSANVLRTAGPIAGVICYILDFSKGLIGAGLPILLSNFGYIKENHWLIIFGALAAIIGHCWPIYLKFKGGKGVATSMGSIVTISPKIFLFFIIIYLIILIIFRYTSLAGIMTFALLPLIGYLVKYFWSSRIGLSKFLIFSIITAIVVIWRHKSNIKRLLNGTERKLGQKVKMDKL